MELSKEVRELHWDAREEICCDECLSKNSNVCPCNEVVRLYQLVEDVVKAERERCVKAAQDAHCGICPIYEVCHNLNGGNLNGECNAKELIRKTIEGENENERQIES